MANSLLDFVMSLVRDPDAAAAYAADPSGAIADAHLGDVTSVDVNNLIPVVSDGLSTAAPGLDSMDGNVWASGAATAAFDAFSEHLPSDTVGALDHLSAPHDAGPVIDVPSEPLVQQGINVGHDVIDDPAASLPAGGPDVGDVASVLDSANAIDPGVIDPIIDEGLGHAHDLSELADLDTSDLGSFDIFD